MLAGRPRALTHPFTQAPTPPTRRPTHPLCRYETIKLEIPPQLYPKVHLQFTFKHCSSTDNHAKKDQLFAFTFTRLVEDSPTWAGSVIKDGEHRLPVFKYAPQLFCVGVCLSHSFAPKKEVRLIGNG